MSQTFAVVNGASGSPPDGTVVAVRVLGMTRPIDPTLSAPTAGAGLVGGGDMRLCIADAALLTVEAASDLSPLSIDVLHLGLGRLVRFCGVHGAVWVDEITPTVAAAFVEAPKRGGGVPSNGTQIQRRWVIRRMFAVARECHGAVGDPTLDSRRLDNTLSVHRALDDAEIVACRAAALGHVDSRLIVIQILAEAGASTVEIAGAHPEAVAAGHVHLSGTRGLKARVNPLTGWGSRHVDRLDPDVMPLAADGDDRQSRQLAGYLSRKLLVAAGLWPKDGVSIDAILLWRAHRVLATDGFLAVAAFTGMNSLDHVAARLGVTW